MLLLELVVFTVTKCEFHGHGLLGFLTRKLVQNELHDCCLPAFVAGQASLTQGSLERWL